MMDDGDMRLREIFDEPTYNELSKSHRLFLGAKYKAVQCVYYLYPLYFVSQAPHSKQFAFVFVCVHKQFGG